MKKSRKLACHKLWTGYESYTRVVTRLNDAAARSEQKNSVLKGAEMTCFWASVALAARESGNTWTELLKAGPRWQEGMSVVDACLWAGKKKLNDLDIFVHDPLTGTVDYVRTATKPLSFGVIYVVYDDKGIERPHWLPVLRCRRDGVYVTDHIAQCGVEEKGPEEPALPSEPALRPVAPACYGARRVRNSLADRTPFIAMVAGRVENPIELVCAMRECELVNRAHDLWLEVEIEQRAQRECENAQLLDDMPFSRCNRIGWDRSGTTAVRRTMGCVELFGESIEMAPRLEEHPLEGVTHITSKTAPPLCEGAVWRSGDRGIGCAAERHEWRKGPEYCARLAAQALGGKGFELVRLSPEIVGEELREGMRVFTEITAPHPTQVHLDSSGCYRMEAVVALLCEHGSLELCDQKTLTQEGRHFKIATLRRKQGPWYRRRWWFGTSGSECKDVLEATRSSVLNKDLFCPLPTPAARIRAAAAMLRPLLDEEVVGPFNDAKLEVLGLEDGRAEGVDLVQIATMFSEANERVRRLAGSKKAFAY